ncbi:MAG TPA: molybdate ABC transporter substrate-binding protein [Dehalococcoidia bacterium]|nr:molybdate ABC transporter substrate-binding protein [Dehalococcoidia bacterium]
MVSRRVRFLAPLLAFLTLTTGSVACAGDSGSKETPTYELTVFAASSLSEVFPEQATALHANDPSLKLVFSFAGSQQLRAQMEQGAHADIFASADEAQMQLAQKAGLIAGEPRVFVHNRLVVVLPKDNRAGIVGLADLARPGLRISMAGPNVPAGAYARAFLTLASAQPQFGADYGKRVLASAPSEEPNVRQVLAKVAIGEADAGFVYQSDVTADVANSLGIIAIPTDLSPLAGYLIAVTKEAAHPEQASKFIDFLLSAQGQRILTSHNFLAVGNG